MSHCRHRMFCEVREHENLGNFYMGLRGPKHPREEQATNAKVKCAVKLQVPLGYC